MESSSSLTKITPALIKSIAAAMILLDQRRSKQVRESFLSGRGADGNLLGCDAEKLEKHLTAKMQAGGIETTPTEGKMETWAQEFFAAEEKEMRTGHIDRPQETLEKQRDAVLLAIRQSFTV